MGAITPPALPVRPSVRQRQFYIFLSSLRRDRVPITSPLTQRIRFLLKMSSSGFIDARYSICFIFCDKIDYATGLQDSNVRNNSPGDWLNTNIHLGQFV